MNPNEYTDEQIQAAIDAAFPAGARPEGFNLDNRPSSVDWKLEAPNRLAIARAFLAALPKPAEPGTYARLKAYNEAGARIRCGIKGSPIDIGWSTRSAWQWSEPVDQYEVHPDDLHMVPEYAPQAEAKPEPEEPSWIPHDGGPCPLKDEEVELWEFKLRHSGDKKLSACRPPSEYYLQWEDKKGTHGITAYRVLRWKPGFGPGAKAEPDPYAELKAAHAEGRTIEVFVKDDEYGPDRWSKKENNTWTLPPESYRIKPEPNPVYFEAHGKPWTPKPGDVVRLKSGGPKMTILDPEEDGEFWCAWFDGIELRGSDFRAASLTQAKEDQP